MRSKARSASAGEWIKESGDGWEAICSSDDQANGNFIIAHFEGPDAKANREFAQAANPDTVLALLDELETSQTERDEFRSRLKLERAILADAEKRIAELNSNEIREDGNQFLVVRHPGKTPVIKHCSGDPEEFLRNLIEQDPLVTIDIITHRYYGVGGQWVQDADEYLHMMAAAGIGVKGE
ncbi:ead/Ea22-like family protein [Salmonella enterica]|nr:ead/Ea22-like family protein [Salmonella enterica]EDD5353298.1 ead/Ea22-like family protein [Salmonella enterica subsp. enterica serovar Senftenberg]EDD5694293.1 ead/Ea22-like family protein [Salmonella enterica subsp. enterica serovar Infantis]EDR0467471.1 ead/Ea22-like family protein [Salmonella enterica subsp. enterica serovar Gallinarum]EDX1739529.1 ead/Ea22-like family protein [Salmonella enterica subsp. enterica serovar Worthington]